MPTVPPEAPRVPLKAWRTAHGLTQSALAEMLGLDQAQVCRQEQRGRLDMTSLQIYADFYGIGLDELMGGPPQLEPEQSAPK